MFKALLRTPKEAAGAKAAAEPTRREAMASFMMIIRVSKEWFSGIMRPRVEVEGIFGVVFFWCCCVADDVAI